MVWSNRKVYIVPNYLRYMEYKELEGIGLTKSEILVYTTLLEIGQSSTGKIVKEAGISSGKIYEILERLIEKGLVSYVLKNNVKHFSSAEPYKIEEYIKKRKQEIENKEKEIANLIPKLNELKKTSREEYSTEIFMGLNGFRTALVSATKNMSNKYEFLSLGGSGAREEKILFVWAKIARITNKKRIKNKFLVTDISKESKKHVKVHINNFYEMEARYLPGFHLAPIVITDNQTIILNFEKLSAIVIKSKTVADQFRFFFDSLWKVAKK